MSQTGEQPAVKAETPLSENTNVRMSFVITIVIAAMAVGAAHYRIGSSEKQIETNAALIKEQATKIQALELGAVGNAATLANLSALVAKMDQKLDRLLDSRTGNAVYRQPREPGR